MTTRVLLARITSTTVDPRLAQEAVWTPADGAVVTFTGIVRNHDGGRSVRALEYSAHPLAESFLTSVCEEVAAAHSRGGRTVRAAAVHRIGPLRIGDVAVAIAVASSHRGEAFAACSELIERIKHEVPIWKRQQFPDGLSVWVGAGNC